MHAVERAGDLRMSQLAATPPQLIIKKSVPLQQLMRAHVSTAFDAPLTFNVGAPCLGDRVVNLNSTGVPFALRGTVVAIHGSTGYVEVGLMFVYTPCMCVFTRYEVGVSFMCSIPVLYFHYILFISTMFCFHFILLFLCFISFYDVNI